MELLLIYLLKANVVISILFLFYLLVLKNEKSFWQNRVYLLSSLLLSLFLPFLPEMSFSHFDTIQHQINIANPLNDLYATIGNSQLPQRHVSTTYVAVEPTFTPPSLMQILVGAYLLVSLVLLIKLIVKVLKLVLLIKNTEKEFTGGIYYCAFDGNAPFSFFRYLVINKQLYSDEGLQQIILHEKVHIRQWHSIDVLFAEFVHTILWLNPLMGYLKRSIRLNHEYIADSLVLSSGVDKKAYQLSILQTSLRLYQAYQLTNLYSSSKIKLRIKMMNLKKSPKAYKYAFVLLLVSASYFLINPSSVNALKKSVDEKNVAVDNGRLKAFEGLYKMPDRNGFIKLTEINSVLVVKQLWDGYEFSLKQKSANEFTTPAGAPFKFTLDKNGNVTQIFAFNQDTWLKVKGADIKEASLNQQQLKALEGIYQLAANKGAYVQVISKQNKLVTKQLWDDKEIAMSARSDMSFFVQNPRFNEVEFTKESNGMATKFTASNKDVWNKVDSYQPPVTIQLSAQELKKFEGYYQLKDRKNSYLQVTANSNGLVLKQLWDGRQIDFIATNPLLFLTKESPWFTLQFTADGAGSVSQLLAFGTDVWNKVDNYQPPVEIKLTTPELKKLEGKYELRNKKNTFLQIEIIDNGLVLKQLWDGREIDFAATSPLTFFSRKQPGFTLQFTSDNTGNVTQVLAFDVDVWNKVK